MTSPTVFGFTFARGGSKGVPGKNARILAGKPLLTHAISHALTSAVEVHFVSTDDEELARIARDAGAEVPFMRPTALSTDTAPEFLAWKHAVQWVLGNERDFDVFVSVPATSPLRHPEQIDACVELLLNTDADVVLTVCSTNHNPFFNMVEMEESGKIALLNSSKVTRRQDAPKAFNIATVAYAARPQFILEADSLWSGNVYAIEIPAEDAIDIDTELDFDIAEFLLKRRLEGGGG